MNVEFKDPIIYVFFGHAKNGKDTSAGFLKKFYEADNKKIIFSQYSKYIKFYAKEMTSWDGNDETKPRELLQQLGTSIIRQKLNKADMLIQRQLDDIEIYSYFYDAIFVSDARLKTEINALKEKFNKVVIIKVTRPNFDNGLTETQKNHITEVDLDDFKDYDYEIINETMEKLESDLYQIYQEVNHKYGK